MPADDAGAGARCRARPSARYPSPVTPAQLSEALRAALVHAVDDGTFALDPAAIPATVHLERPRQRDHGDWATNVAMQLAKKAGTNPRAFAEELARRLAQTEGVATVEVAGPGFLNIRLDAAAAGELRAAVVEQGDDYGHNETLAGVALNLEFVSANPTGPLHIGGVRWAAVGDCLARVLQASGAAVSREYYFNDHGAQIDRFARSLLARALGRAGARGRLRRPVHLGDRGAGDGRRPRRRRAGPAHPADDEAHEAFRVRGVDLMFAEIKRSLHEFGVDFDVYFHEDSLHESGAVDACGRAAARAGARLRGRTVRRGCAPRTSVTTRTASSSSRTARPPTSPATSRTTWTSVSAASTAS